MGKRVQMPFIFLSTIGEGTNTNLVLSEVNKGEADGPRGLKDRRLAGQDGVGSHFSGGGFVPCWVL